MSRFPSPPPPPLPKSYLYPTTLPSLSPSILSDSSHLGNYSSYPPHRQVSTSPPGVIFPTSYSSPTLATSVNNEVQTRPTHQFRRQRTSNMKSSRMKRDLDEEGHDWLLRTASALTTSTLEEKGQAWLVTRSSSTSLTEPFHSLGVGLANDKISSSHPAASRSLLNSRTASRVSSRRGSVGAERGAILTEPDFVTPERELLPDLDEGEMKRIVMGRVGGWVDWALGWIDFNSSEENDTISPVEIEEAGEIEERGEIKNNAERHEGKSEFNHGKRPSSDQLKGGEENFQNTTGIFKDDIPNPVLSGEGGWSDAKWLLQVAESTIL